MALTAQDQKDLMALVVVALDVAPGRTIFNELAGSIVNDGATLGDIASAIVAHPLFSDNTIGEYPVSQTNAQFANEFATRLLGDRGDLVEGSAWDEAVAVIESELNGGLSKADLIVLATNFLMTTPPAPFQAAADALANKVEVALYQAVELELDVTGSSLAAYRALLADVDDTQASVDAAKADLFAEANTVNLTPDVDIISGNVFISRPAFTPGGNTFINTLQDEDVLTAVGSGSMLHAVIGGVNDNSESEIAPTLNGIEKLKLEVTDTSVEGLDLQDATGLLAIEVARITDQGGEFIIDNVAGETNDLTIAKATTDGYLEVLWREDELTGTETLNLMLNSVRFNELILAETGDTYEDQGYFFETINVEVDGNTNLDEFFIMNNWEESESQTLNLTADANLEINWLDIDGVSEFNIVANDDIVIGEDEDDILWYGNDGIDSGSLDQMTITGAGDVAIDGLDGGTVVVDGSAMTGDLALGTWALNSSSSSVTSGSGNDEIRSYYTLWGDVTTNAGNDMVVVDYPWGDDDIGYTASISTGDGNDSVYADDLLAGEDSEASGNSSFGEAEAAAINTGSGNDTVAVDAIRSGYDWNNGDLLDSNVDDTYFINGATVETGTGSDSVSFTYIMEGAMVDTGADNDSVSVSLGEDVNDDSSLWWQGGAVLGEDTTYDEQEVDLSGDEDFVGAKVLLGSGDDVISFTNSYSDYYEGDTDFIIVGEDALLDGGDGNDTLNITVLDELRVTPLAGGEEGDENGEAFNAYIKGIETVNLTIADQVDEEGDVKVSDNDDNDEDGQVWVDVLRFDSDLAALNLISKEQALEEDQFGEQWNDGTATSFNVFNMREGVELTLSANEATGVDEGDLVDDEDIDVYLYIDHADADGDDDSVTLNVSGPNANYDNVEDVDLDIEMGWTFSAPNGYEDDTDYLVENLTLNFEAGGSHYIYLNGFGDSQFDYSDDNIGSFMQWRNLDPENNVSLAVYNATSTATKQTFGQGYQVDTSLTIANTEAGEQITVEGVTADVIHITGDAAVHLTVGEDDEGGAFENNYDIMTGTDDDVVDMYLDLVDDEDAIDLGEGDNDRLIISGDNNMGFSTLAQPENDEVWHNKHGIEILEIVANDGDNTIVLDEEAFDTGIRQIDVTGSWSQAVTVVIGEDFDASGLTINADDDLDGFSLSVISSQDDKLTVGDILLNADGGASFSLDDVFDLINVNLSITINNGGSTQIGAGEAGAGTDGSVEVDVTNGAIETITLLDEPGESSIFIEVADEWNSSVLVIDLSDIADDDDNDNTGGAEIDGLLESDAELVITGTANDDYIITSIENDTISGGDGDDIMYGEDGDDTIDGGDGDDELWGMGDDDTLNGGDGDDVFFGGLGADDMTGGAGDDVFVYTDAAESSGLAADTINGFNTADDLIDLSGLGIGGDFVGNFLTTEIAETQLTNTAGETFYITSDQLLWVDVDGSGDVNTGDMVIQMTGLVGTLSDANFAF